MQGSQSIWFLGSGFTVYGGSRFRVQCMEFLGAGFTVYRVSRSRVHCEWRCCTFATLTICIIYS